MLIWLISHFKDLGKVKKNRVYSTSGKTTLKGDEKDKVKLTCNVMMVMAHGSILGVEGCESSSGTATR